MDILQDILQGLLLSLAIVLVCAGLITAIGLIFRRGE